MVFNSSGTPHVTPSGAWHATIGCQPGHLKNRLEATDLAGEQWFVTDVGEDGPEADASISCNPGHLKGPPDAPKTIPKYRTIQDLSGELAGADLVKASLFLAVLAGPDYEAGADSIEAEHVGIGRAGIAEALGVSVAEVTRTIGALNRCAGVSVSLDAQRHHLDGQFYSTPGDLTINVSFLGRRRLQIPEQILTASPNAVRQWIHLQTSNSGATLAELAEQDGTTERTANKGIAELAGLDLIDTRELAKGSVYSPRLRRHSNQVHRERQRANGAAAASQRHRHRDDERRRFNQAAKARRLNWEAQRAALSGTPTLGVEPPKSMVELSSSSVEQSSFQNWNAKIDSSGITYGNTRPQALREPTRPSQTSPPRGIGNPSSELIGLVREQSLYWKIELGKQEPNRALNRACSHATKSGLSVYELANQLALNPPILGANHPVSLLAYRVREATQRNSEQTETLETESHRQECESCQGEQWIELDNGQLQGCTACGRRGWVMATGPNPITASISTEDYLSEDPHIYTDATKPDWLRAAQLT